jgi:hypothetical protein
VWQAGRWRVPGRRCCRSAEPETLGETFRLYSKRYTKRIAQPPRPPPGPSHWCLKRRNSPHLPLTCGPSCKSPVSVRL